jgi:hypothetical protein
VGCCCNPTTRCGDWLIHARRTRASHAKTQVTRDRPAAPASYVPSGTAEHARPTSPAASVHARPYRCGTCGDSVGAARRGRGTPAQMRAGPRAGECRMADWGNSPRGDHPGGEEYSNGRICPPGGAVANTPGHMIASADSRFFTRTCVWRNLSKATTVVQQGDHREGPT